MSEMGGRETGGASTSAATKVMPATSSSSSSSTTLMTNPSSSSTSSSSTTSTAAQTTTSHHPTQKESKRHQKNEEESKSVPGSPKIENRRIVNQRRQFHSHHSGSSSECQTTKKSNENLNKDSAEDENERLARSNSMALGGGSINSTNHGRRSSAHHQQPVNNYNISNTQVNFENMMGGSSTPMTSSSTSTNSNSNNVSTMSSSTSMSTVVTSTPMILAEESDSDLGQNQPSTSNSRSRQKKFLKTFKHLPQEEVVLQRYSCALVSDILLQGHLYITQNYFAFYSNVFGYVTKLQIPIRSVTKLSKEKTAKIIPNAVGLCTEEGKHIFASLLSRDSTFKLMNRLWTRALRDLPTEIMVVSQELPLETELEYEEEEFIHDEEDDLSSDSDGAIVTIDPAPISTDAIDSSYLVKRMSQGSGSVFYHQSSRGTNKSSQTRKHNAGIFLGHSDSTDFLRRRSSSLSTPPVTSSSSHSSICNRTTILSLFVIVLLIFLLCSSVYLVFRVDALQRQVESRYGSSGSGKRHLEAVETLLKDPATHQMQETIHSNVDQITTVRKSLEKLSEMVTSNKKEST